MAFHGNLALGSYDVLKQMDAMKFTFYESALSRPFKDPIFYFYAAYAPELVNALTAEGFQRTAASGSKLVMKHYNDFIECAWRRGNVEIFLIKDTLGILSKLLAADARIKEYQWPFQTEPAPVAVFEMLIQILFYSRDIGIYVDRSKD